MATTITPTIRGVQPQSRSVQNATQGTGQQLASAPPEDDETGQAASGSDDDATPPEKEGPRTALSHAHVHLEHTLIAIDDELAAAKELAQTDTQAAALIGVRLLERLTDDLEAYSDAAQTLCASAGHRIPTSSDQPTALDALAVAVQAALQHVQDDEVADEVTLPDMPAASDIAPAGLPHIADTLRALTDNPLDEWKQEHALSEADEDARRAFRQNHDYLMARVQQSVGAAIALAIKSEEKVVQQQGDQYLLTAATLIKTAHAAIYAAPVVTANIHTIDIRA